MRWLLSSFIHGCLKTWTSCNSGYNCIQDWGHLLAQSWSVPFLSCRKYTIRRVPRFWHLPSWVGNSYFWNKRGSQELCLLCWCYCGNTLLVVWKSTELGFQLLSEMSQLWWLSYPSFLSNGSVQPWKKTSTYRGIFFIYLHPAFFW